MAIARKLQINLEATQYYHCVSRCVRRAFLCGVDNVSGRNYEHRRGWVQKKLLELPNVFAIDVCAFAVMSNHTHCVLHVNHQLALNWSTQEVFTRWHRLFKGTNLTRRYSKSAGRGMTERELRMVVNTADVYRSRLMDISWFMRSLNEFVARKANKEDDCTGRFWEGRFKCQALLDEQAILCCMIYVDTNPIRAGMSKDLKSSCFTSIKLRLEANKLGLKSTFLKNFDDDTSQGFLCEDEAYINLISTHVKTTSCQSDFKYSTELSGLNWQLATKEFEAVFHGAAGNVNALTKFASLTGRLRRSYLSVNQKIFGDTNAMSTLAMN